MHSWLEGRNWVGKCAPATGMTASLRILSSKADSNTCESFTRSELKLESVHQESPRSDIFRKRATKPLLKQKHCQKHLTKKKTVTVPHRSPRKNRDLGPSAGKVILIIKSKANRQKQNSNQKRDTPDGNVVLVSRAHKPNVIGEQEKQWTYIHMWVWVI